MRIDDTLLKMMIEKDIRAQGISAYTLSDHIYTNPTKIDLGVNQMAYVVGFSCDAVVNFSLKLISAVAITSYSGGNCVEGIRSLERKEVANYSSTVISSHIGGITIEHNPELYSFYLRVIRLEQIPNKEH